MSDPPVALWYRYLGRCEYPVVIDLRQITATALLGDPQHVRASNVLVAEGRVVGVDESVKSCLTKLSTQGVEEERGFGVDHRLSATASQLGG